MNKLLWLDLEMTGLDVEKENIIEVAAIVTDMELNFKDTFHSVVNQPQHYLDNMDNWNKKHHSQSGLLDKIPLAPSAEVVEKKLLQFVNKNFKRTEDVVLAGNSIHQDRVFLKKYFKHFSKRLHYRMLDVSSWKLLMRHKGLSFTKTNSHQALDDIRESIEEMKFYLSKIQWKIEKE
jgi:oligoribonuclease